MQRPPYFREGKFFLDAAVNVIADMKKYDSLRSAMREDSGYLCIDHEKFGNLLLGQVGPLPQEHIVRERDACLENAKTLMKRISHDLSRESGTAGAVKSVPIVISFSGTGTEELDELVALTVAVRTCLMNEHVARDRTHYFPTRFAKENVLNNLFYIID